MARMAGAAAAPLAGGPLVKKRKDGDVLEIAYLIGDVRAHRSQSTYPITIVPRLDFDELENLDIAVTATGWPLDSLADPES